MKKYLSDLQNAGAEELLNDYADLVTFLGKALGEDHEIALLDCRSCRLAAIANGHISGRSAGDPLTDLAARIIETGEWKHTDYIVNYTGIASDRKLLRSSTYFIKHENELIGMLCINVDTTAYRQISDLALKLSGLPYTALPASDPARETFVDTVTETARQTLQEMYGDALPDHFSHSDRTAVIRRLYDRGIFRIKGSVQKIAGLLGCSEPTIYRGIKACEAEDSAAARSSSF